MIFIIKRHGKFAKAFIPLRDENGQIVYENKHSVKKESLMVSRIEKPNGEQHEIYFESNDFEKGKSKTIIDFISTYVLKEEKIDFRKVTGILYQYMNNSEFVSIENSSFDLASNKSTETQKGPSKKIVFDLPSKNTFSYLKSRGIDLNISLDDKFIGTYGSYTNVENEKMQIVDMPAFILTKNNKKKQTLQWIDFKNGKHTGKYFVSDVKRESAFYRSNFEKNTNTICLIENPEKAMAHYQLFKKELNEQKVNVSYLSSCGNLTLEDLKAVKELSVDKEINKFILAFDNDLAGKKYTLNTVIFLAGIEGTLKHNVESNVFSFKSNPENENKLCEFLQKNKLNFSFIKGEITINEPFEKLITKFQSDSIKIHTSITKDFLDDMNENKKLPFHFKSNTNNLTI